ncbi:hypothetical protein AB1L42_18050 [Thalassoglobus sp. JC818]|uniref:hypothetical protein n=1 Tax=Thalassoglobus sp. JC818 TaxID=3232136 RepID=UPI003457509B
MKSESWEHVTLDGFLPLVIAASPTLVAICFREGHIVQVVAAVVAPVLAAFLRAAIGIHQLESVSGGHPNWGRQVLFSLGIVLLLLSEIFVSTLQFAQNESLAAWFFPAGLFCFYLTVMQLALSPDPDHQRQQLASTVENVLWD